METPMAALTNSNTKSTRKMEDSDLSLSKSRQRTAKQDRSVLVDITNDSPIVGLASGNLIETPISYVSKQKIHFCKKTPGSGEDLLRGQVKNLLQKVEEEAEISKFCIQNCGRGRHGFKAIFNSPASLVAPTPVNTPQILNFSSVDEFESLSPVSETPIEDQLIFPQVMSGVIDEKKQSESEDIISRSLFLDFSEKSDSSSDSSAVVTTQETQEKTVPLDDDDSSIWSIQVNASIRDDDEGEDEVNQDDEDGEFYDDDEEEMEDHSLCIDELCEEISNLTMDFEKKGTKLMGKHIRFVYHSDDEFVEDYEEVLHLKGLPTPTGKHVRFQDEDEDEDQRN
ncbi:uncharacterized protein LOC130823919 [Amaranthus tricolor]|uniref:uncharacterized protein LOC130823919 n=1 Tax=Amaranthus tricolor TaxID=29722 RepID=UPI0025856266|nr:uncharacterized protein LOC130823919 [Amaranthus tricolor]